ncbi:MAG: transposase [Alicyclobacillus sp.]|nr:transposase [Alicyclobacillus sp.]
MLRLDHGLVVNEKKVYRLCKELDILRPQRKLRQKHPREAGVEPHHRGTKPALGSGCQVRVHRRRGPHRPYLRSQACCRDVSNSTVEASDSSV